MNPINYVRGLMDEHDSAVRSGNKTLAGQIRAEVEKMADDAKEAIAELRGLAVPSTIEVSGGRRVPTAEAEEIRQTGRRLEEFLKAGTKRTAAAAEAPEKAATPPAK